MSALGPKRTSLVAPHRSAFGGKADIACCGNPLSWSLWGVKRTCFFALHMTRSFADVLGQPLRERCFDMLKNLCQIGSIKCPLMVLEPQHLSCSLQRLAGSQPFFFRLRDRIDHFGAGLR
jgi:hypothetical protein